MRDSSTVDEANDPVPATASGESAVLAGLHALRTASAWMPTSAICWIAVTGPDRVRWLNGMVTNSVQALTAGSGAYTFLLSAQGRIQGDAVVWAEPDRLLLETDCAQVQPLLDLLDRFIIMDDIELVAVQRFGVVVAGPAAAVVVESLGLAVPAAEMLATSGAWQGHSAAVLRAYGPAVPRYELWFDTETAVDALTAVLAAEAEVPAESFELLRLLEQRPVFAADGTGDLGDRDLPQETAQTRALHFSKGCYLGQEIVERIRSRGQVHRTFSAFTLQGEIPPAGTELLADGKPAGLFTSIASQDIDGERLALGFARREALERGSPLTYAGGIAEARRRPGAS